MKKNILHTLILIISLSLTSIAFWDCSQCKIKDGPPEALNKYLENIKKIRTNISKELSQIEDTKWKIEKDINATSSKVTATFNSMIDWDSYYSLFDFYVMYSAKNEYVLEVWRDYNLLETESKWMEKYLKFVTSKWYDSIEIPKEKVCAGIENCDFWWKLLDVIWGIIKNQEAMKDYYRLSIVGKKNQFDKKLQLVNVNFTTDFWQYYNENTTKHCSQCEWASFDKIKKEIEKISDWQQNGKDGIKSWQEAIAMMDGTNDKRKYEKKERELLQKQMAKDGTNMNGSANALKNLDKYNQWWGFSLDNNFITNSFDYVKNAVSSQIESFTDSISQQFRDSKKKSVATRSFSKNSDDLKVTKTVEEKIKELYQVELPYAQLQDTSTENFQWKIIELHFNLVKSIEMLDKTKKVSEKVCNSQWKWLGKCETK